MHHRLIILGSTGSIGCSALDVVRGLGPDVRVVGLAAGRDWAKLAEQARRFRVGTVAIADETCAADLARACPPNTRVLAGPQGLVELVQTTDADFVLAAIVGVAGLPATLAAVERGIDVGLANKESLVVAGSIIMPLARQRGCRLIPVDSEHSAIFQALMSGRPEEVRRIYLTASGGPFRTWPKERIAQATIAEALDHPTWSMGPKITIDSATMMNKALEIIEAHYLFDVPVDRLQVLVHPESIVHSMVEFRDGSVIAQLGTPDMRTPIQYAITYPQRAPGLAQPLTWDTARRLNFEPPDPQRFPALTLGHEAAQRGGTCGAVLNAANEAAVERFRAGEIQFGQIAELAGRTLRRHRGVAQPALADLMAADAWARQEVDECIRVGA
ncbi:MAG: 1-deoxy-D-xylulose-5-phosphate reductoisomerase [Phycisphaerae bacterium]|jgi:1-deoxy-D-xylulose-5-phosphate reductoisomerase|nr:1-deoxy-D-xylulose-5-phosphate reductoisomerase [Phycisphaerae bacterium]HOO15745.1 1-deoxy-D-xylulose-5-phosphate reductoisomerase [Phycisphaerae bacterium]HPC22161.1 1-deoxy-D-xylulose-5-phosphate reductoisomerase [Phycisphaerae bacterium]HRT41240.1 1-deoxy-D-xylulose-5-phosphate reductoisomerase [Phycisphaerae bacterium]